MSVLVQSIQLSFCFAPYIEAVNVSKDLRFVVVTPFSDPRLAKTRCVSLLFSKDALCVLAFRKRTFLSFPHEGRRIVAASEYMKGRE